MPKGVYIRTEEHNKKISNANKGRRFSKKTEFKKGHFDFVPKKAREKAGKKISKTRMGHIVSEEIKQKLRIANYGKKQSEETKRKRSLALKGRKITWREKLSGQNNRLWKGNTPLKVRIRKCFEYKQWRLNIFIRDNYTCVLCNLRGGYIEVDHFPSTFISIFEKNKISSFEEAVACEDFWNLNNGRTLCKKCHRDTDTYGGRTRTYKVLLELI